jgi:hypothetical protein
MDFLRLSAGEEPFVALGAKDMRSIFESLPFSTIELRGRPLAADMNPWVPDGVSELKLSLEIFG